MIRLETSSGADTKQLAELEKDLAKAREVVLDKSKSLQEIEQDLDALTKSKTLLKKTLHLNPRS